MRKIIRTRMMLVFILALSLLLTACGDDGKKTEGQVAEGSDLSSFSTEDGSEQTTEDSGEAGVEESTDVSDSTQQEDTTESQETTELTESTEEKTTDPIQQAGCDHSYGEWKTTREATCSKKGAKQRECATCGHKETGDIATVAHKEVKDAAVSATCTTAGKTEGKHCSVCNKVIVKQETVKALGHKEVTVSGKQPTETASGLTAGKKCSTCGKVTVAQVTIAPYLESCNDDYGYKDLGKQSKGSAKQSLYTRMDTQAKAFHCSSTMNANGGVAFSVKYSDLGLTEDEAIQVWITYKGDHPLYYWMSVSLNIDDSQLYVLTDSAYASGSARAKYNAKIYQKIAEYCQLTASESSEYMIALAYHDAIISAIDYAYESDGATPEDAEWAHNILGVFEKGSGVCEAYARTFQLLLNVSGVENVLVVGTGGRDGSNVENHAWNIAKMDDGKWYWFDLTWDDTPEWELGIVYNYFCVNDTQNVNWDNSQGMLEKKTFVSQHKAGQSTNSNPAHKLTLPSRSGSEFTTKNVQKIKARFKVDGINYAVSGYNTVQLLGGNKTGVYKIPETVKYISRTYTVTSLGNSSDPTMGYYEACFNQSSDGVITKLVIPKTVKFIWDNALFGNIQAIEVDKSNPYFTSVDGVLFTKSMYTLIQYPYGKAKVSKYTIPDATRVIARGALSSLYNGFGELVIGKNVNGIGYCNWGYGYQDKAPTGPFGGNYVSGELARVFCDYINKSFKITVASGNSMFVSEGGVIYNQWKDEGSGKMLRMVECLANTDVTTVVFADNTVRITDNAFCDYGKLISVTICKGMEQIGTRVFLFTGKLKIKYNGTVSQWNKIDKSEDWAYSNNGAKISVQCTDGTGN